MHAGCHVRLPVDTTNGAADRLSDTASRRHQSRAARPLKPSHSLGAARRRRRRSAAVCARRQQLAPSAARLLCLRAVCARLPGRGQLDSLAGPVAGAECSPTSAARCTSVTLTSMETSSFYYYLPITYRRVAITLAGSGERQLIHKYSAHANPSGLIAVLRRPPRAPAARARADHCPRG